MHFKLTFLSLMHIFTMHFFKVFQMHIPSNNKTFHGSRISTSKLEFHSNLIFKLEINLGIVLLKTLLLLLLLTNNE